MNLIINDDELPTFAAYTTTSDTTFTIRLSGELDVSTTEVLRRTLSADAVDGASRAVVDLHGLTFCDASGIRALIALQDRLTDGHRTVTFRATRRRIRFIMKIAGADLVLSLEPHDTSTSWLPATGLPGFAHARAASFRVGAGPRLRACRSTSQNT